MNKPQRVIAGPGSHPSPAANHVHLVIPALDLSLQLKSAHRVLFSRLQAAGGHDVVPRGQRREEGRAHRRWAGDHLLHHQV